MRGECVLEWSERRCEERGVLGSVACVTLFFSRIPVVVYVTCPAK